MLTVPEAARRLAKNPETIRRWIRSGRLPARKIGTQHVIEEEDLERILDTEVLPLPASWTRTWTDEPMPNWVSNVRQDRDEH
jgi:DNA binding domain, excisionase family